MGETIQEEKLTQAGVQMGGSRDHNKQKKPVLGENELKGGIRGKMKH